MQHPYPSTLFTRLPDGELDRASWDNRAGMYYLSNMGRHILSSQLNPVDDASVWVIKWEGSEAGEFFFRNEADARAVAQHSSTVPGFQWATPIYHLGQVVAVYVGGVLFEQSVPAPKFVYVARMEGVKTLEVTALNRLRIFKYIRAAYPILKVFRYRDSATMRDDMVIDVRWRGGRHSIIVQRVAILP